MPLLGTRRPAARLAVEVLESRVLPSALNDAAFPLLHGRQAAGAAAFFLYQDADSGYNRGFPTGFFGAIDRVHLDTAAIDDPASPTGTSTDANRLDRARGTVLRIGFDPMPAGTFAGVNFEEPAHAAATGTGRGYDLRGATAVVFDVRSPTPGGVRVRFGVGDHVSPFMTVPQSATYTTVRIGLDALEGGAPDLADVRSLFTVVTNDVNAPNGGTVLIDNLRFDPVPTSQTAVVGFPLATQTFGVLPRTSEAPGRVPIPLDQLLRNVTTIYESATTLMALIGRGAAVDLGYARQIADAFVYAVGHDNRGLPIPPAVGGAGLHNAYSDGALALFNDQNGGALAGEVRLAGFTCATLSPTGYCLVLDGATGGNNAFALLGLLHAYRAFADDRYLSAARTIGRWLVGNLEDSSTTGYGGYFLGYPDEGKPKVLLRSKSVENNADIFAALGLLADTERGLGHTADADFWRGKATAAGDYVMAMFDPAAGRFNAGSVPIGTQPGPGIVPTGTPRGNEVINVADFLDANTFTTLALAADPRYRGQIDWRRPVRYVLDHFRQTVAAGGRAYQGFDLVAAPTAGPNGVAWEFTGQAVVQMRFVDRLYGEASFRADADFFLAQLRSAQQTAPFADGQGLVAATVDGVDALPPIEQALTTPFQNLPARVGLAATTWAIFADAGQNPLSVASPQPTVVLVGCDAGAEPRVNVYDRSGVLLTTFLAFPQGFTGGVRVATADFNEDGVADYVVGTGPGVPTQVRVLDGKTLGELRAVSPFEASFIGGVFVAAGDVNGDGTPDLVISPDEGGGPRVRVLSGIDGGTVADFFGIEDPAFRGGARVSLGDVSADGRLDLLVAAGFGGGPRLAGFDGRSVAANAPVKLFADFFVFEQTLRNGVFVAAGDLDGGGSADVVAGGGPGGGPRVYGLSGRDLLAGALVQVANYFAGDVNARGGIRVAVKDLDGDARFDLVAGDGPGGGSRVIAYAGASIPSDGPPPELWSQVAFPGFTGGVFVG